VEDETKKTARPLPTAEEVRALLDYDPATGLFRWRESNSNRVRVGDVAGCPNGRGYTFIGLAGKRHRAHRLAWLWVHGTWPAGDIDHRDGQRSNNALANLREVTIAENRQNVAKQRRPTSSRYIGVSWAKREGRWEAYINHGGKQQPLGYFPTEELAYAAYLAAKAQLHTAQPVPRESAYSHRGITTGPQT
jgi:hypothetical protein